MTMKPLKIVSRETASLLRDPQNARLHPQHQIDKLIKSIQRFGFINPILLGEGGVIIAGHGRLEAAREMGLAKVPCIELAHLSDVDRRAYALADNRISEDGGWSMELLKTNFEALKAAEFDLGDIGFRQDEVDAALSFSLDLGPSMDFTPDLQPTAAGRTITESDVERQERAQDKTFSQRSEQGKSLTVICPHCGEEYAVRVPE